VFFAFLKFYLGPDSKIHATSFPPSEPKKKIGSTYLGSPSPEPNFREPFLLFRTGLSTPNAKKCTAK